MVLLLLTAMTAPGVSAAEDEAQGIWIKKGQKVSGSWSFVEESGKWFLVLDDAFKTRSAPDLKLFLSKRHAADVTSKNATGEAILIAELDKVFGRATLRAAGWCRSRRVQGARPALRAVFQALGGCQPRGTVMNTTPLR